MVESIETAPTRRTLVRAAAWSPPAIALAAAAPAEAATSGPHAVVFQPGSSGVAKSSDSTWRFVFAGATFTATGGALSGLTMTVTFAPDTGSPNSLAFYQQGPDGWLGPTSPLGPSGTYVYTGGPIAEGTSLAFPDGSYFATAFSSAAEKGSIVLTFSAAGFQDTVYAVRVPGPETLTFDPGSSYVTFDPGNRWALDFQGASVGVHGGDLAKNAITMTVTFTPDSGFTSRSMAVKAGGPSGWSASTAHTTLTQTYTYLSAVTAGGTAPVGDGAFFFTAVSSSSQPGTFTVVFSAPGFTSVTYKIHGPKSLAFNPGTSAVVAAGNDRYAYHFQGASVSVQGADLAASALSMSASFVPDAGYPDTSLLHARGGPDNWSQYPTPGDGATADYTYLNAVSAGAAAPISDGAYLSTEYSVATQQGKLRLTFAARELQPVTYDVPVEVALSLTFQPGSTYTNPVGGSTDPRGLGLWNLIWGQAAISPHGAGVPAGGLAVTVTFQADDGSTLATPLYQGGVAPPGWTVPPYSKPGPTDRIVYLSGSSLAAADVITLNGTFFTTNVAASQHPGQFVTTFSAVGFTPVTATWAARPR